MKIFSAHNQPFIDEQPQKLFPKHLGKKYIFTFEKIHPYLSNRQAKELMQSCGMFSEALKKKMFSINSHFFQMHFFAISDKANKK